MQKNGAEFLRKGDKRDTGGLRFEVFGNFQELGLGPHFRCRFRSTAVSAAQQDLVRRPYASMRLQVEREIIMYLRWWSYKIYRMKSLFSQNHLSKIPFWKPLNESRPRLHWSLWFLNFFRWPWDLSSDSVQTNRHHVFRSNSHRSEYYGANLSWIEQHFNQRSYCKIGLDCNWTAAKLPRPPFVFKMDLLVTWKVSENSFYPEELTASGCVLYLFCIFTSTALCHVRLFPFLSLNIWMQFLQKT